jgi:hypothetical protein
MMERLVAKSNSRSKPRGGASGIGPAALIGRKVVLDTAGPITYLGTLAEILDDGFVLTGADYRDRSEGHITKEAYVCEARANGINANRARVFVFHHVVISISALDDVILN